MIFLKSPDQIEGIRRAARAARSVLDFIGPHIVPGVSTAQLERLIHEFITQQLRATPTFRGYRGFPASACISLNQEVVHGIPSEDKVVQDGDLVKVDVGVTLDGFIGDVADTFIVGRVSPTAELLVKATRESLFKAVDAARPGARLSDIGHAVESHVARFGFTPVRELTGHGVGLKLHEEPMVPNYGPPGSGPVLHPGMTLAIEPMINIGGWRVKTLSDGWTVVTEDGSLSAHYEHDIVITETGAEILSWTE